MRWMMKARGDSTQKRLPGRMWVSEKSMAGYCMVSPSTIRRWIHAGKISAITLPSGHYRITIDEFKNFSKKYGIPISKDLSIITNVLL
jgi:excisionase family DNA binding protein